VADVIIAAVTDKNVVEVAQTNGAVVLVLISILVIKRFDTFDSVLWDRSFNAQFDPPP
jgi:hypothetical protein